MNHIDNIKSFNEIGLSPYDNKLWKNGYLKACKQFEKEVEELKEAINKSKNYYSKDTAIWFKEDVVDKTFTHKEAMEEEK